jgi:hypothetical protein
MIIWEDVAESCHDLPKNDIPAFAWRDREMSKCLGQDSQSSRGDLIMKSPNKYCNET